MRGIFLLHGGYRLCQALATALPAWLLAHFGQKFGLKGHLQHRVGTPGPLGWKVVPHCSNSLCNVAGCLPAAWELLSWKLGTVWHGEPSQASLFRCPVSHLLVTLLPLKTFRLQAAWWKRLLRVTVCALILQMPRAGAFPSVCYSFALLLHSWAGRSYSLGNCELAVLLLSSFTYSLSPGYCFYFCAVNVNQTEKMWWFIYVNVFENNVCVYFNITMR